jgi:hypothetical protein
VPQWFEIDLDWPVASQYVARAAKKLRGHRAIFVAEGATLTMRRPFDDNPNLYAEFADLDGSERSYLQFAHKYGTLIVHSGSGISEPFRIWHGQIQHIREIIECCRLGRARPTQAFHRFGKREISLSGLEAYLSIVSPKAPPTLTVRCESFSGALKLQAIRSILGGRDVRNCIECSKPFEIGAGAHRSQSKFCSIRCKDTYHNRLKAVAKRGRHA